MGGEEDDAYFEYADVIQQCLAIEEFRIADVNYVSVGASVTSGVFWQEAVDSRSKENWKD